MTRSVHTRVFATLVLLGWLSFGHAGAQTAAVPHELLGSFNEPAQAACRLRIPTTAPDLAWAGVAFSTYTAAQMEFLPAFETICWTPLTLLLALTAIFSPAVASAQPGDLEFRER